MTMPYTLEIISEPDGDLLWVGYFATAEEAEEALPGLPPGDAPPVRMCARLYATPGD